jgi:uncharacterized membrane protein YfcA
VHREFNQPGGPHRGPTVRRRYASVAGALCAAASLLSLPGVLLDADSADAAAAAFAALLGAAFAVPFLLVSWERASLALIEAFPAVATLVLAINAVAIDPGYGFYLVLVAGVIAYEFMDARVVGVHLTLIFAALAAPIALGPSTTHEAVTALLIYGPGALLLAWLGAQARRRIDARDLAYQQFGLDALAIATRIRSRVAREEAGSELAALLRPQRSEQPARSSQVQAPRPWRWVPATGILTGVVAAAVIVGLGSGGYDDSAPRQRPTAQRTTGHGAADRHGDRERERPAVSETSTESPANEPGPGTEPEPTEPAPTETAAESPVAGVESELEASAPSPGPQPAADSESPARPATTPSATPTAPPPAAPQPANPQPADQQNPLAPLEQLLGPLIPKL